MGRPIMHNEVVRIWGLTYIYVVMSLVACALGLPCWCSWPRQLIAGEYSYLDLGHFWAVCHVIFGIFHFGGRREENNIIIIEKTRQTHHPPAFVYSCTSP
jgi:hypothetical protein